MITLNNQQKEIKARITSSIQREISMCDDYIDLMVLASVLYDSSKHIFSVYTNNTGLEPSIKEID
jgi:hypothetical protein